MRMCVCLCGCTCVLVRTCVCACIRRCVRAYVCACSCTAYECLHARTCMTALPQICCPVSYLSPTCGFNVCLPSATLSQHSSSIGSKSRGASWEWFRFSWRCGWPSVNYNDVMLKKWEMKTKPERPNTEYYTTLNLWLASITDAVLALYQCRASVTCDAVWIILGYSRSDDKSTPANTKRVEPPSTTSGQHWNSTGSTSRICLAQRPTGGIMHTLI